MRAQRPSLACACAALLAGGCGAGATPAPTPRREHDGEPARPPRPRGPTPATAPPRRRRARPPGTSARSSRRWTRPPTACSREGKVHIAKGRPVGRRGQTRARSGAQARREAPGGRIGRGLRSGGRAVRGTRARRDHAARALEPARQADRRVDRPGARMGRRTRLARHRHERLPHVLRTGAAERRGRVLRSRGLQQPRVHDVPGRRRGCHPAGAAAYRCCRATPGPRRLVGGVLGPVDPEHFSATGV